jgi:WD40 repeat protein
MDNLMASRLTLLYGSSGVGKSSVLRAGVVYPLRELAKQNLKQYGMPEFAVVYLNTWRDDPLKSLLQQVEADINHLLVDNPVEPVPSDGPLDQILRNWVDRLGGEAGGADLFIIFDQFEEYFLYHPPGQIEDRFSIEFSRVLNCHQLRVNFLISIREDSYANLDRFKGRIPNLFDNYLRLDHLTRQAARTAILKPIEEYNRQHRTDITIEPKLVEAVLDQVRVGQVTWGEAGRGSIKQVKDDPESPIDTPYLQLVMTRLWHKEIDAGSTCLQLKSLTKLGDAKTIAWNHLKRQISALTAKEKKAAAAAFQYLVTPGGTKIAYPVLELTKDTGLDETDLIKLLEKLASGRQRIVRPVGPSYDKPNVQMYEIFHDVLAPAVLDWRQHYLERQRRKKIIRNALSAFILSGVGMAIFSVSVIGVLAYNFKIERLTEKEEFAWDKFEDGEQLFALKESIIRGQQIETWVDNKLLSFLLWPGQKERAIDEAKLTLQRILSGIKEKKQFSASPEKIDSLTLSSDWQLVATNSTDGEVQIWELTSGKELQSFQEPERVLWSHFSPDGQTLVIVTVDGKVHRWDWPADKMQTLTSLSQQDNKSSLKFSPQSPFLAFDPGNGTVQVWNWTTDKQLSTIDPAQDNSTKKEVRSFKLSTDGQMLATISVDDEGNTVQVWDSQTGRELDSLELTDSLSDLRFSSDGESLAIITSKGMVRLWHWQTDQEPNELNLTNLVSNVAFSPNGKTMATVAFDGTIQVWNWETNQELAHFKPAGTVLGLWFSPILHESSEANGQRLALVLEGNTLSFWTWGKNAATPQFTPIEPLLKLSFSPDGQRIITFSSDTIAQLWDAQGQWQATLTGHEGPLNSVVFSPDGQQIATASADNTARLWDAQGQWQATLTGHEGPLNSVVFSPDGQQIATASADNTARLWDAQGQWQATLTGHEDTVTHVLFSPDGRRIATVSSDDTARLWDASGQRKATLQGGDEAVFNPNGHQIVTTSRKDRTARLWDTNGNLQDTLPRIISIVFSPDGHQMAITSTDGVVRILPVQLDGLLNLGCKWLQTYLKSNPDQEAVQSCQSIP